MASRVMTTPYSTETFHKISKLPDVRDKFCERDSRTFVLKTLGNIVKQYSLEEVFGVGLIHRHFDIDATEKLVEFNNVTTPWTVHSEINKVDEGNSIVYETSWVLDDDSKWMPYEFAFSPTGASGKNIVNLQDEKYSDFLSEFTDALKDGKYEKLFGLRIWPGDGFKGGLEFTANKANIVLLPGQFTKRKNMGYTETMWFWTPQFENGTCKCECGWSQPGFHLLHSHISSNTIIGEV